jgi:type IX secretion system PorP/SprF family membrane protein
MKKVKLLTALSLVSVLLIQEVKAQDIHFSQFYMSPLTQNPALTGAEHELQAVLNYKNQWASVADPYTTIAGSFDMRLGKSKGNKGFWAVGINFYSDKAGDAQLGTAQANLSVAYHVWLAQYSTLGGGLQLGYAQRSINYSALQWGNQYDGTTYNAALPTGEPTSVSNSVSYIDGSAGINWNYDNTSGGINVTDNHDLKADVGFAVFHVNQPKYSFYTSSEKLYMRYVFHGNGLISLQNSNLALAPGFVMYLQGGAYEIYLGSLVRFKLKQDSKYTGIMKSAALSIGAYYRTKDALVAAMLLEYSNYAFGISYDINTSTLTTASNGRGGMEVSLRYVLPNPFYSGVSGAARSMY